MTTSAEKAAELTAYFAAVAAQAAEAAAAEC